jgi:excisionase family DNA binding protein
MNPLYSTHEAASLLQVNPSTVSKWVEKGVLVGFKTPGGHRRIRQQDLIAFIKQHGFPMPSGLETAEGSSAQ